MFPMLPDRNAEASGSVESDGTGDRIRTSFEMSPLGVSYRMQKREQGEVQASPSLERLRELVSQVLCQRSDFEEGIFQITERLLKRGQQMCGIFFCLHGPRSVKLTAVWESEKNSIRFYGSTGEKFKTITLENADDVSVVAA